MTNLCSSNPESMMNFTGVSFESLVGTVRQFVFRRLIRRLANVNNGRPQIDGISATQYR